MKRVFLAAAALLAAGCSMPEPIPDADRAFARGDYSIAAEKYADATDRFLTPTEHRRVASRLVESVQRAFRARFDAAKRDLEKEPKETRLAAYRELWLEARDLAKGESEISTEILIAIDEELASEWSAVDELMQQQKVAEAMKIARHWAQYAPPESGAMAAYESRRALAAEYYESRGANATTPHAKALFQLLVEHYMKPAGGDEAMELVRKVNEVPVRFTFDGPGAQGCEALPRSSQAAVLDIAANIATCKLSVTESQVTEPYVWVSEKVVEKEVTVCQNEQVGTRTVQVSSSESCGWRTGAAQVLQFYTCTSNSTYREVPVIETVCRTTIVSEIEQTNHDAERTVQVKTLNYELTGTYTAALPDGQTLSAPFEIKTSAEERQYDTPHGSLAFSGTGGSEATADARSQFERAVRKQYDEPYREAQGREALNQARAGVDADENFAIAAMLGNIDATWLTSFGMTSDVLQQALRRQANDVELTELSESMPVVVQLEHVNAGGLFGTDATAARGFPASKFEAGTRYRAVRNIPTQADRVGLTFGFGQSLSFLALAQQNAWGFGFEDQAEYFLDFGGRVSEPHVYRNFGGGEDETENWGSGGAGVAYGLGLSWRTNHIGLRLGARAHASTFKLGDLVAAETGMPFTAQLELRANERYPLLIEGWGFSPFGDRALLGGKITLPMGAGGYFVATFELAEPTINVGGRNEDDRVRVGRHPTQLGSAMFAAQF